MPALELAASGLAKAVANKAVTAWLSSRSSALDRGRPLRDLIAINFHDKIKRRRFERQLEDIADSVLSRLNTLVSVEFSDLDDGDITAAVLTAVELMQTADLSDARLFEADANSVMLSRSVLDSLDLDAVRRDLGAPVADLFVVVLKESIDDYVNIVVSLDAFIPRSSQEMLSRLSQIGAELEGILARMPIRRLQAPSGSQFDEEFRREYLGLMDASLNELELFGVDIHNYSPRTNLATAYISLNVNPDFGFDERVIHGPGPRRRRSLVRRPPQFVEEVALIEDVSLRVEHALSSSNRLLVRGEAGSGKSTLLRWLVVSAARESFTGLLTKWNGCTPFLIKLRSYAGQALPKPQQFLDDFASAIVGHMPDDAWVDRQLSSGQALILIDGVDELVGNERNKVRSWLRGLLVAYPSCSVIVTSRPAAAANDWLAAESFKAAYLERMAPSDIRLFIHHWYAAIKAAGNLPPQASSANQLAATLSGRLRANPNLLSLASSPLLCAMLCALNLDRKGRLPRDRMGLYGAALTLLLHRRDTERNIPSAEELSLDDSDKVWLLSDLAWRLSLYNRSEGTRAQVVEWLSKRMATMPSLTTGSPETVFEHLLHRSGVIREPVKDRIDFVHRTFQEYLAAAEAARQDHIELLIENAHLDIWREVIIMTCGHANTPLTARLLSGILNRSTQSSPRLTRRLQLLAAACLETAKSIPEESLRLDVENCLDVLAPPKKMSETGSLASAGLQVLKRLPVSLEPLNANVAAATVRTACLINGAEALDRLAEWGADARPKVVAELVAGWSYFDPRSYAERVLRDSPLENGELLLVDPDLFSSAPLLEKLKSLGIFCNVSYLHLVPNMAILSRLSVYSSGQLDIELLPSKAELDFLTVTGGGVTVNSCELAGRYKNLSSINIPLVESDVDINWLTEFNDLHEVFVGRCDSVSTFPRFSEYNNLEILRLHRARALTDVSVFGKSESVRDLSLTQTSLGPSIDALPQLFPNLTTLSIRYDKTIKSIDAIGKLTELEAIDLEGCELISDLGPLSLCTKLAHVDVRACHSVKDLSPLGHEDRETRVIIYGIDPEFGSSGVHDRVTLVVEPAQGRRADVAAVNPEISPAHYVPDL